MRIAQPHISYADGKARYQADVYWNSRVVRLWYSLDQKYSELISDSSDAALIGLLIPAMAQGTTIHVDGALSDRLWYNLPRLQSVLRHVIPRLREVQVQAQRLCTTAEVSPRGIATGFSGGIDSFCVLADNFYAARSRRYTLTHLLFNNVGSHGEGATALFRRRYARLAPLAKRIGLPFLMIDSNLDEFYGDGLGFQQTHTLRNASVALLLQRGLRSWMYASAVSYRDVFVRSTYDTAYCDAVTLPLLSLDSLDCFSVGSEYTRVEKTIRVADVSDSHESLDVCVNAHHYGEYTNCSACWKCLRTLATLDIAGLLSRYEAAFDIQLYRTLRSTYLSTLSSSSDPLARELVQFATDRGYEFPILARLRAAKRQLVRPGASLVRRLAQRTRRLLH